MRPYWVFAILVYSGAAVAQTTTPALKDWERNIMSTRSYIDNHPDLRHRQRGLAALAGGEPARAMAELQRAAWFADKPAQALVAELYATGQGTRSDPVAAYAWMDLAAERGYEQFLALRELYWSRLDPTQQAEAVAAGQAIYAHYGDAAAQPRMARALRWARRQGVLRGNATAYRTVVLAHEGLEVPAHRYYATQFWHPSHYEALQDRIWQKIPNPQVDVGPLEPLEEARSRPPAVPMEHR